MSGTKYQNSGGGVNYQCLPLDPEFSKSFTGNWQGTAIAGVEYETKNYGVFDGAAHDQNVPCARCYTDGRPAVVMVPAMRSCAKGWSMEYEGVNILLLH